MKKYVSLSFDDGPSSDSTMNDMLNVLEHYQIKASFYLIGNKINEKNTKVIKRAFDMGCDIQNHSWTQSDMTKFSIDEIKNEYAKTDDAIINITGKRPEYFRPPYIAVSYEMYDAIKVPFICGKGCEDWLPEVSADDRCNRMLQMAEDGTIFLLHVMEGNQNTVKAVDTVVPLLLERGYEFVTVPELFKLKGINPNKEHSLWDVVKDNYKNNTFPR
ncbi:MAG: polysaccharide deacetylase family protein [Treponema sp.]|nr:polysaccharide deacetylase family protein [Treponema sp.]